MADKKIEPCPFCKGECEAMTERPFDDFYVVCQTEKCEYISGDKPTEAEAIAAHNKVSRANAIADDLLATCRNTLASLHILGLPQLDSNVATNKDIITAASNGLRAAIAKAEGADNG